MSTFQRIVAGLTLVGALCALVGWLMHIDFVLGFGVGIGLVGAIASLVNKRRGSAAR
jgi:hypothetical protein